MRYHRTIRGTGILTTSFLGHTSQGLMSFTPVTFISFLTHLEQFIIVSSRQLSPRTMSRYFLLLYNSSHLYMLPVQSSHLLNRRRDNESESRSHLTHSFINQPTNHAHLVHLHTQTYLLEMQIILGNFLLFFFYAQSHSSLEESHDHSYASCCGQ